MYPPPSTEIVRRFVGDTLELVAYGQYVTHLSFASGNKVSFAAPHRYGETSKVAALPICEFPLVDSQIISSLGSMIDEVRCDDDGSLELQFSSGNVLIVYANDPAYEAYTLLVDGKEYLV
jgi:hypothetical protein